MSGLRSRLTRVLGADPAAGDEVMRLVDELRASTRADLDRQAALAREVASDLAERLAAIERRLDALEQRGG